MPLSVEFQKTREIPKYFTVEHSQNSSFSNKLSSVQRKLHTKLYTLSEDQHDDEFLYKYISKFIIERLKSYSVCFQK